MLRYPLIRFTIPLITGIVINNIFHFASSVLVVVVMICLILLLILLFLKKIDRAYSLAFLYLTILLFGAAYHSVFNIHQIKYPFKQTRYKNAAVYGKITEIKLQQGINYKLVIETDSVRVGNDTKAIKINMLVRVFPKDDENNVYEKLEVGNYISVTGIIKKGRTQRNPGEYDYQNYLQSVGISALLDVYTNELKILDSSTNVFYNSIHRIRKNIDSKILAFHNKDTAALLRGLLLADRGMIDYELKESFMNAGVVHVLAVSGLHVGYIILIFLILFNRTNIVLRYLLTTVGLILFLFITGSQPSVFRATIMAVVLLFMNLSTRKYNAVNTLFIAALILLLIDPNVLFMPGFQLSFSAVLSILLLYPRISKSIVMYFPNKSFIKGVILFICVSLSAQIGTLPFTLHYFGKLSLSSLFANLIVIPLIGIIVANGIFTISISFISATIANIYASANELIVYLMNQFIILMGDESYSYLKVSNFSLLDSILFYVMVILVFVLWKYSTSSKYSGIVFTIMLLMFFVFEKFDEKKLLPDGKLSIMMIDVGQGDSFLLKFPNGKTALIDGGEADEYFDNGERVIIPLLDYLGIKKINYGFITHLDSDHLNGFLSVIKKIPIDTVYRPLERSGLKKDSLVEKILRSKNIAVKYFHSDILKIDDCRIYILNDTNYIHFHSFDINNKSGVMKLVHGLNEFIFTGDIEKEAEEYFAEQYQIFLKSDVLKTAHHGSKTSSTTAFLDYVMPEYALICAGENNRFNHPSKSVLEKLKEKNILTLRTDKVGAVVLCSDGKNISQINWKK